MATRSILKEIKIKDRISARRLINALENSGKVREPSITLSRPVSTATEKEIKQMFGAEDRNDRV